MTDRSPVAHPTHSLYERPTRHLLAAMRALRTVPGPQDPSHARALRSAARRTGRTIVEVSRGQMLLGWDADTEGIWAGEGMASVRSARPAQPRLLRALAACLRCCWVDPDSPIYPAVPASIDEVLAAVASLSGTAEPNDSGLAGRRHARSADDLGCCRPDRARRARRNGVSGAGDRHLVRTRYLRAARRLAAAA